MTLFGWVWLAGCGPAVVGEIPSTPDSDPWLDPAPPLLADTDPDENRFVGTLRVAPSTWEPSPGVFVQGNAYNGTVPGPLIRVAVGSDVSVTFVNDNAADWEDTVHWHGIEGNNAADGTGVTQSHVHPGGSFVYDFRVTRPGLYWYHPHHRGAQGVFNGSYGPLWVQDADEAELVAAGVLPSDARVLVLADVSEAGGVPFSVETDNAMEIMNGTEGSRLLVNGVEDPVFEIAAGGAVRLLVLNASIVRFWRLSVPGHTLYRVGGQGGLLDAVRVEGGTSTGQVVSLADGADLGSVEVPLGFPRGEIVLAPAERADLVLVPNGVVGDELELRWEDVARGRHGMWMAGDTMVMGDADDDGARLGETVATFRLVDRPTEPWKLTEGDPVLGAVGRTVGRPSIDGAVNRVGEDAMVFSELMDMSLDANGIWQMSTALYVDGQSWLPEQHSGPTTPLSPTSFTAKLGETLLWEVRNESDMSHPVHIHGFSYQMLSFRSEDELAGTATTWSVGWDEWVDTTRLPSRTSLFVAMPLLDPVGDGEALGRWMRHCHIFQHGENGMMSEFSVER